MTRSDFTHYESVDAFLADVRAAGCERNNVQWCGDTWSGAMDKAANGDLAAVDEANAIMDSIDHQIDTSGLRPVWGNSPVGAYPNVPAFLAGDPESMRARTMMQSPKGPVTIWFSPVCSAAISVEDARRRGLAVLALVLALQRVRPVHVRIVTAYGKGDHTVQIRTEPMVLAEAAHCLTATSFYRALSYEFAEKVHNWKGGWAPWYKQAYGDEQAIIAEFRTRLNANADDLIVLPMDYTHGAHREMIDTPATWINRVLDQYRQR